MTAPTPEQMRALADRITNRNGVAVLDMDDAAAALRTAADQLEAVREQLHNILNHHEGNSYETHQSLYAWYIRLAAETAPQEGRDEG